MNPEFSITLKYDVNNVKEHVFKISDTETKIGRGKLFAINDKQVSRNHCALFIQDDQLILKSFHNNPCFLSLKNRNKKILLKQGGSIALEDQDQFSLLQDKYIFLVKVEKQSNKKKDDFINKVDNDNKIKSQKIELLNSDSLMQNCFCIDNKKVSSNENKKKLEKLIPKHKRALTVFENSSPSHKSPTKQRKLPNWMNNLCHTVVDKNCEKKDMLEQSTTKNNTSNFILENDVDLSHNNYIAFESKIKESSKTTMFQVSSSCAEDNNDANKVNKTLGSDKPCLIEKLVSLSSSDCNKEGINNSNLKTDEFNQKTDINNDEEEKQGDCLSLHTNSFSTTSININDTSNQNNQREPCIYGKNCYRKNPIHFHECSHPGDADYFSMDSNSGEDDTDNRPECEYGLQCYRKNQVHRKKFKHTRRINPKRTSTNTKPENYSSDEYDDSFIDDSDDDETLSDESDWTPSQVNKSKESSSDSLEDIDDLVNDAKHFQKNKKLWKK